MNEAEWQRQVLTLARLYGWRTAHFLPGLNRRGKWRTAVQGDGKGFPDLILVRERVIWCELKLEGSRLRPEQSAWIGALRNAEQEVYLWRPCDAAEVERVLRRPERES